MGNALNTVDITVNMLHCKKYSVHKTIYKLGGSCLIEYFFIPHGGLQVEYCK